MLFHGEDIGIVEVVRPRETLLTCPKASSQVVEQLFSADRLSAAHSVLERSQGQLIYIDNRLHARPHSWQAIEPKWVTQCTAFGRVDLGRRFPALQRIANKHVRWCREGELNPHEVAFDGF